ncbi:lytic murein transglycosylase [Roseicyclus persicicus]|uniref:Lytic murein transglycosylase n=1 Tax=Roseicyclus persicicus TaxID=2650661 RepID=A0A7X6H119_9RHOB|nr:lytic murein transglycosylase [Roseibacterium persicicum]NKX45233.1 lytic murein transglycosylase [Roseibacterium persicicum]
MRRALTVFLAGFLAFALPALALPPATSLRPEMRPGAAPVRSAPAVVPAAVTVSSQATPLAVTRSLRPLLRGAERPVATAAAVAAPVQAPVTDAGFATWLDGFRARARTQGISDATLTRAFSGVQVQARVLERDRNQAEFSRALWDYLDSAVSATRVANGRDALARHRDALARIERRYGVEAEVVVAVWGLESAYGAMRGDTDIIAAMATLAYDGRRRDFFEEQLIAALRILQAGDVAPRQMTGSWAGAMGHTQFMPTSYLQLAVDFDGDGRRDIWSDDPIDALASTANYLRHHGWTTGQPWGMEVRLPEGFDYGLTGERVKRSAAFWNDRGVRLADGGRIPDHGEASILLPAGHSGVALVIFDNFHVIERYNPADAYVIAVGHLSDRIAGGDPFRASWPREDRALSFAERQELQRRLVQAGFHRHNVDGIVGPETIDSVRRFQASIGWVPDGYASLRVLQRLRGS